MASLSRTKDDTSPIQISKQETSVRKALFTNRIYYVRDGAWIVDWII